MKFQNPGLNYFLNGRKDERTNERTNERTSRNQYAPHFFKVGGIKRAQFRESFNVEHVFFSQNF